MEGLLNGTPLWLAIGVVIGWYLFQRRYEARISRTQAMEERLAERRQKLYDRFMNEYWAKATAGQLTTEFAVNFLREWNREAWLVASDKVIQALIRLTAGADTQEEMFRVVARLMVAIRRDMGNPATFPAVGERDFLRLLIRREDWGQIEHVMRRTVPDKTTLHAIQPKS